MTTYDIAMIWLPALSGAEKRPPEVGWCFCLGSNNLECPQLCPHLLNCGPIPTARYWDLTRLFAILGAFITYPRSIRGAWDFECPGQIISDINAPSFVKLASKCSVWGYTSLTFFSVFRHWRGYIFRDANYFLDSSFACFSTLSFLLVNTKLCTTH